MVFFTGRAYKDADGKVYLALKDFDPARIGDTGLALQWLVDELEKCPAKEKLLLLDASHAGTGADLAMEPSAEEMLRLAQGAARPGPATNRHGHRQLPGRPAERRLAREATRPVRLARGAGLFGGGRQEPRQSRGVDRVVRLSARRDGRGRRAAEGVAGPGNHFGRRSSAAAHRRGEDRHPQVGAHTPFRRGPNSPRPRPITPPRRRRPAKSPTRNCCTVWSC